MIKNKYDPSDFTGPNGDTVDKMTKEELEQELCRSYDLCEELIDAYGDFDSLVKLDKAICKILNWLDNSYPHLKENIHERLEP